MFSDILGQGTAIEQLRLHRNSGRLPSTYLFHGKSHVGRHKTALAFAQWINCQNPSELDACGVCQACQQIQYGSFPNLQTIQPDGRDLKIEQVQQSIEWIQWKPDAGQFRCLIVDQAEALNQASANAFLKTLEEPPPQTLIILLVEQKEQLLETILSRCCAIAFQPLSSEAIAEILNKTTELDASQVSWLSQFSMGTLSPEWHDRVSELQALQQLVITQLTQLTNASFSERLSLLEQWIASKDWEWVLTFMEYWLRDLAWTMAQGNREKLFHQQHQKLLTQQAQQHSLEAFLQSHQLLIQTRHQIASNANKSLAFDALWIDLKNLLS